MKPRAQTKAEVGCLDIGSLNSIAFTDRATAPRVDAVYFILGIHDEILYIGNTCDLWSRVKTHNRLLQFIELNASRIAWIEIENYFERKSFEIHSIWRFKPCLNRKPMRNNKARLMCISGMTADEMFNAEFDAVVAYRKTA